jgi:hypothetical protein
MGTAHSVSRRKLHREARSGYAICGRETFHTFTERDLPNDRLTCPDCRKLAAAKDGEKHEARA